jgi:hypothetical protein
MQSQDLEEIKAALWEQAYHPCTRVSWGMAQVMAARYRPKMRERVTGDKMRDTG